MAGSLREAIYTRRDSKKQKSLGEPSPCLLGCAACSVSITPPGTEPPPLQWTRRILTPGTPGKSPGCHCPVRGPSELEMRAVPVTK